MKTAKAIHKKRAIQIINHLPDDKLASVVDYLEYLASKAETYDVRDVTEAVKEGLVDVAHGRTRSARKLIHELQGRNH
jgi:hypothetical protein